MTTPVEATRRLQAALDELARALVSFSADATLRAEESVATAVSGLARIRGVPVENTAALRAAVANARDALVRCQALGRSAVGIANGVLQQPGYGPTGAGRGASAGAVRRTGG